MNKEEFLLNIGFEPASNNNTFYYYLDRGRKLIVDINVVNIDGYRDAVYLKQLEDYVYLFEFNEDKLTTIIKYLNN